MPTTRHKKYAEGATTAVETSQMEARRLLKRYGADATRITDAEGRSALEFRLADRLIRFTVAAPTAEECRHDSLGRWLPDRTVAQAQEREYRRRWRVLILRLKARLEAVTNEGVRVEEEFLANLVVRPDGATVADLLLPQIEEVYRTGQVPALMPQLSDRALPPYVRTNGGKEVR
jgi:hypothetical protein